MRRRDNITWTLLVAILTLQLLPRPYLRRTRSGLARLIYWQWKKMSHLSAVLYWQVYERINGQDS